MKKLFSLFFTVIFLFSCSENEIIQDDFKAIQDDFKTILINSQIANKTNGNTLSNVSISGVKIVNGMIHFKDLKSYSEAKRDLEKLQFQDIENFNSVYLNYSKSELSNLSENELDEISDKLELISKDINFSETGIYEQFEKKLNFNSLRSILFEKEEIFLNNPNPNWELDPDNHFIVLDEERTFLNADAEIKIGNSIYKFTEQYLFEITDGNYDTLLEIKNNGYNAKMTNVIVTDLESNEKVNASEYSTKSNSNGCKKFKSKSGFRYNSNNTKRIKWVVKLRTFFNNKLIAKTVNYKKKGKRWVKYKTSVVAANSGSSCQGIYHSSSNYTNLYAKSVTHKTTINYYGSFKSGYLNGHHYGAGGISYVSSLTW